MPTDRELLDGLRVVNNREELKKQAKILEFHYPVAQLTKLTGNPEWDSFRSLIQGKIDELTPSLEKAEADLKHPRVFENLLHIKHTYNLVKAQIDILELVLELPGALMEEYRKAEKLLADVKPGVTEKSPSQGEKNGTEKVGNGPV